VQGMPARLSACLIFKINQWICIKFEINSLHQNLPFEFYFQFRIGLLCYLDQWLPNCAPRAPWVTLRQACGSARTLSSDEFSFYLSSEKYYIVESDTLL
jgi:hypothetical protein